MEREKNLLQQLMEENKRIFNELKRKKLKLTNTLKELEEKNRELAESNKNLSDSINYARRIQGAIMPPEYYVKKFLPDSFILYKPRDVVSGDFYFVDNVEEKVVFAAVDATGHGVPGALLSVIGFNFISQAVNEKGFVQPAEILSFLDAGVNNTLRQTANESGVHDGMDLSLCTLDPKTLKLQFAGAYNPIYIVTERGSLAKHTGICHTCGTSDKNCELHEIKADKLPIGVNLDGVADQYTNHEIQLARGNMIYLFSDGYADQFGGPLEKKFMYKKFRDLILTLYNKSMEEQKQILDTTIINWQGNLEQVDDILIFGVRI